MYEAEINLQKPTLAKYYAAASSDPYCWPPHQVRKTGLAADDLSKRYDSGWNMMNWGPARICARACHAYINNGDAHAEKMMRFLAERWMEETGGDPARIRLGYKLDGCAGWGDATAWMLGSAAMVAMVSEQYRLMLDRMYDALVAFDVVDDPHAALAKAYYLMHLTGLMDFSVSDGPVAVCRPARKASAFRGVGAVSFDMRGRKAGPVTGGRICASWFVVSGAGQIRMAGR